MYIHACIVDAQRRAYIYMQPISLKTELTNRKTGKRVLHTSIQRVITLDNTRPLMGAIARDNILLLLTDTSITAARI